MIEPGLYRHYRGQTYRVLFVAPWWGRDMRVFPDQPVYVTSYDYSFGIIFAPRDVILSAKWSGNESAVLPTDMPIVIYVALYGDGRVSARPLGEFAESVQQPGDTFTRPRFERIGP